MSDGIDLTLLGGTVLEIARDLHLLRLQFDNLASRSSGQDGRFAVLETTFDDLVGEVARGFGQQQQHITRLEERIKALDVGLTALRGELAANFDRLIATLGGRPSAGAQLAP